MTDIVLSPSICSTSEPPSLGENEEARIGMGIATLHDLLDAYGPKAVNDWVLVWETMRKQQERQRNGEFFRWSVSTAEDPMTEF